MLLQCRPLVSQWPGGGEYLATSIDFLLEEGLPVESDSLFLEAVYQLLQMDAILYQQCRLGLEDFADSADPHATETLTAMWNSLGGPRNAYYFHEGEMPWSPGSVMERAATALDTLAEENPDDYGYHLLRLRFYYLVLVSLWWNQPVYTEDQRILAVNSIVANRRMLTVLLGEDDSAWVTGHALTAEYERSFRMEKPDMTTLMEHLRTDITQDRLEPIPVTE
jgi:hypothetical protein